MNALFFALLSVFVAVVAHAAVLRLFSTRFVLVSLMGLVVAAPVALGAIFLARGIMTAPLDLAVGALLAVSLGAAYTLLFVGIAYDSPTLALVNAVADCGEAGMPVAALEAFVLGHPFVSSRLAAMVQGGVLTLDGERWVLRGGAGPAVRLCEAYRALCTRQTAAG